MIKNINSLQLKTVVFLLLWGVAAAISVYVYGADINKSIWPWQCSFYNLLKIHCPGCGGTRALWYLLHGEIITSLRHNFLLIPLGVVSVTFFWFPGMMNHKSVPYLLPGAVCLFFLLRNIPVEPFIYLAPPR